MSTGTEYLRYDAMTGPGLDPDRWQPLGSGSDVRLEPDARTTVADGTVTVEIPRFTNSHTEVQGLDNTKHVLLSTRTFPLPATGTARFAADLRAEILGDVPDYRYGYAAFTVIDLAGTHQVFTIASTGDHIYAGHETLGAGRSFNSFVEDPEALAGVTTDPTGFRRCEIEFDKGDGQVVWRVDDVILHVANGQTALPDEVRICFAFFTVLTLGEGRGSCIGQGARASWRCFGSTVAPGPAA